MENKKFKGALFDLDGTLADNYSAIHKCTCEAFARLGIPAPSYDTVLHTVGGSILITMQRLLEGTPHAADAARAAEIYLELYDGFALYGLKAMPFAADILRALRASGMRLGCFTNKQQSGAETVLKYLGLFEYFDCVAATSLHSPRKPDPEFTMAALAQIGLGAGDVVCVGDSPYDYRAATSCNVAVALVATGGDSRGSLLEGCPNALGVFANLRELSEGVFGVSI